MTDRALEEVRKLKEKWQQDRNMDRMNYKKWHARASEISDHESVQFILADSSRVTNDRLFNRTTEFLSDLTALETLLESTDE